MALIPLLSVLVFALVAWLRPSNKLVPVRVRSVRQTRRQGRI